MIFDFPLVHSEKDAALLTLQVTLTERERQKLEVWSRIVPYREPFAWAIIPLFETGAYSTTSGIGSPSSPITPSISGLNSHESPGESIAKAPLNGKLAQYSNGGPILVEIANLNAVKESYTEDSLQVLYIIVYAFHMTVFNGYLAECFNQMILCLIIWMHFVY